MASSLELKAFRPQLVSGLIGSVSVDLKLCVTGRLYSLSADGRFKTHTKLISLLRPFPHPQFAM